MRRYVDAMELNVEIPDTPENIRADITDKTDAEIAAITRLIIEVMYGRTYRLTKHDCWHDESEKNIPCQEIYQAVIGIPWR